MYEYTESSIKKQYQSGAHFYILFNCLIYNDWVSELTLGQSASHSQYQVHVNVTGQQNPRYNGSHFLIFSPQQLS